jgi:hypothetical protein
LIGPIKSKPHFIKCSYAIANLSGLLPLRHIGSNHWQMSHLWHKLSTSLCIVGLVDMIFFIVVLVP